MAVILSFKYQLYWRVGRTKKLLATIWFVGFILGVGTCVILLNTPIDIFIVLFTTFRYCQLVLSIAFVFTALSTYATIFWKYRKSRNALQRSGSSNENGQRNSQLGFRIPALIIFTFVIFNSVPISIWFNSPWYVFHIMLALGYVADGLIYIFLQPEVRKQLFSSCCGKRDATEPSNIVPPSTVVASVWGKYSFWIKEDKIYWLVRRQKKAMTLTMYAHMPTLYHSHPRHRVIRS